MAVFDNDGLLLRRILSVWEDDGVLRHEISAAFDDDGALLHRVFSSGVPLYENGKENTELTGGLTASYCTGGGSVRMEADGIKLASEHNPALGYWSNAVVWTKNPVDVTGFSALHLAFSAGEAGLGQMWLLAGPMRTQSDCGPDNPQNMSSLVGKVMSTAAGVLTLDLSEAAGPQYLGFVNRPDGGWQRSGSAVVTKFWLS